jgi:hypothetical protein
VSSQLQDRLEVVELVSRYAHAIDRRDWGAFDAIFDDPLALELPHVESDAQVARAEFVRLARETVEGFEATHHPITNHVVELAGDRATCVCYAQAWHTVPTERGVADYCVVRGFYEFGAARTDGGWRLDRMKVEFHGPVEGWMGVYDVARRRAAAAR